MAAQGSEGFWLSLPNRKENTVHPVGRLLKRLQIPRRIFITPCLLFFFFSSGGSGIRYAAVHVIHGMCAERTCMQIHCMYVVCLFFCVIRWFKYLPAHVFVYQHVCLCVYTECHRANGWDQGKITFHYFLYSLNFFFFTSAQLVRHNEWKSQRARFGVECQSSSNTLETT